MTNRCCIDTIYRCICFSTLFLCNMQQRSVVWIFNTVGRVVIPSQEQHTQSVYIKLTDWNMFGCKPRDQSGISGVSEVSNWYSISFKISITVKTNGKRVNMQRKKTTDKWKNSSSDFNKSTSDHMSENVHLFIQNRGGIKYLQQQCTQSQWQVFNPAASALA